MSEIFNPVANLLGNGCILFGLTIWVHVAYIIWPLSAGNLFFLMRYAFSLTPNPFVKSTIRVLYSLTK